MPVPPTRGPDQGLNRRQRVTRTSDFEAAYAQGRKFIGRFMVLWLRAADDARLRLGVVTSRKVGDAPDRVRARRLLREAYRRQRAGFVGKVDVVLVARATIVKANWTDIVNDLLGLARRAELIK